MSHRGWSLNALQHPPCLHLCVTMCHVGEGKAGQFLADLLASTLEAGATAGEVSDRCQGGRDVVAWLIFV